MKKRKLKFAQSYQLQVYGVSTSLKGYKLCWHLGSALSIDFQKLDNLHLPAAQKNDFACFKSLNTEKETCFVIENEYNGSYYLPKYKIADFFIVKYIDPYLQPVDNLKLKMQEISQIQAIFPISVEKPKEAEPFMIDF